MIDRRDYFAPGPPDAGIRMDILAARELLVEIALLHRPIRALTISDPTTRVTLSALRGAREVMGHAAGRFSVPPADSRLPPAEGGVLT